MNATPSSLPIKRNPVKVSAPRHALTMAVNRAIANGSPVFVELAKIPALKERTFQTFQAWKTACKKDPRFTRFDGNREICDCARVGEWDGEKGVIYATRRTDNRE